MLKRIPEKNKTLRKKNKHVKKSDEKCRKQIAEHIAKNDRRETDKKNYRGSLLRKALPNNENYCAILGHLIIHELC